MNDDKTFYITTPIYYVNAVPHVGSATTTLIADALARFHRLRGEPTFFLTGTDEHAQKVADAASKAGQTPQAFVDDVSGRFRETWDFLHIQIDDFIRTSEPRHKAAVAEVFRRLLAAGDIYAGQYEGWYSVSDETFLRDSEVRDGKAIDSGAAVIRVTEENYFFRLSRYAQPLREYIDSHPDFLQPHTRRNEVLAFIEGGLRDVAVSRPNAGWGIAVPDAPSQVVYVWFDAVVNYLTATGWPHSPVWDTLWPADLHLVGKEIYTRFHATLWPAMLMALGLELPRTVLGHGWWLVGGEKGSKSKGNIPTPQEAAAHLVNLSGCLPEVAVDALRYYLLRDISFTSDAEFSLDNLVSRYNADLANDLGNLLNRSLNMLRQYAEGIVPEGAAFRTQSGTMATASREAIGDAERALLAYDPGAALSVIFRLVSAGNKEIDTQAPWKRAKLGDTEGVADALYAALETCRIASVLLFPFLPRASVLIRQQLGLGDAPPINWQSETQWGLLPPGTPTQTAQPLFPRIDTKKGLIMPDPTPALEAAPPAPTPDIITIDDFLRVKLRVAEVISASRIDGATKLLRLTVDVGEDEDRQILAGIAENHAPEDLVGKKIVVVANLAPRKMRGLESQGMLLAATDEEGRAILLHPESEVAPGAQVR